MLKKIRLKYKFVILMIGILAASLSINLIWTYQTQVDEAEKELLEKAEILVQQLDSVWEFMAINQNLINYDDDGSYNFKGLHCSIVGKSIGTIFSEKTDYLIRYIKEEPRNVVDTPDDFELIALQTLEQDNGISEYWEVGEYEGETVLRYLSAMYINATCLECHGEPAGEIDVTGYEKEGMEIGDFAGAVSLVLPMDTYFESIENNVTKELIFFSVLMLVCVLIIYFAVSKLVTKPLGKLEQAVSKVENGEFNIEIDDIESEGEIKDLAEHFAIMTEQLESFYGELENKVFIRTQELAEANKILNNQREQLELVNIRLQEDNIYKSDFLAIMSHELRTPLTSVIAFTEILQTKTYSDNEEEENILDEINHNSQILLSLINNILDMARIESGKNQMNIEMVDLIDVINSVESVVEPLARKKQIKLNVKLDTDLPLIQGDWEKLRRIVENLLGNAIKFTQDNGNVSIMLNYLEEKQIVQITIEDDGIGIKKEDQEYIFEKFVQSDSSVSRKYNGSGLGLALAKELVELHGGSIALESKLGIGSKFIIELPAILYKEGEV